MTIDGIRFVVDSGKVKEMLTTLTYADVCCRMLTYADVCRFVVDSGKVKEMLTYADIR